MPHFEGLPINEVQFALFYFKNCFFFNVKVEGRAALLGFVGAPWTIATYIVEGGTTRTYKTIKSMCQTAPHILKALLSHLTQAITEYVIFQVESGAHCIQIFDSWGGQLPPHVWEQWSKPYIMEVKLNIHFSRHPFSKPPIATLEKFGFPVHKYCR